MAEWRLNEREIEGAIWDISEQEVNQPWSCSHAIACAQAAKLVRWLNEKRYTKGESMMNSYHSVGCVVFYEEDWRQLCQELGVEND